MITNEKQHPNDHAITSVYFYASSEDRESLFR